ncbi:MAG: ribosome maturation factor RimP [Bacteriovoracia bacterium]
MTNGPTSLAERLESIIAPSVKTLGYELLELEYQPRTAHGGALLRLFIDSLSGNPISFEDCVAVDNGLDPLFESPEFIAMLSETFTLEVSSPGIDRPLKKPSDFSQHAGKRVQIKTHRALTAEEMANSKYFEHHQKQKNFFGILRGFSGDFVEMETDNERFKIPFALIAKAHLDLTSELSVD